MKTTQEKPQLNTLSKDSKQLVRRNEKGQLLPGSILNPVGTVLGTKHLSTQLAEMLFEKAEGSEQTHGTLLNKRILKKSIIDGDMRAIELVYDRVEGAAVQENRNINIHIERKDDSEIEALREEYEEKLRAKLT